MFIGDMLPNVSQHDADGGGYDYVDDGFMSVRMMMVRKIMVRMQVGMVR